MQNKTTKVAIFSLLIVLVTVALTTSAPQSEPKQCNEICPAIFDPVCGYDSNCYARFPNKCQYDQLKCSKKHNLETVDMSLCDLAERRTHPDYKLC
ncbi:turripeptide Pal9.2-like [Rhagoletis pomonella]|uniref:turripeptide Pal9.2-like n=1 Tax=Rhagoletis pomonella TaxID=28610 RepID=UPI00177FE3B9|nr:turripeptide Pal9.2-like [Rhagoletis pomonella]